MRMAIARDYLRADGRGIEAEARANCGFDFRAEMRGVAHGAGHFADREITRGVTKAREIAAIGVKPIREFQTEGDGLGMNTVGAANLRRVLKLASAALENVAEADKIVFDLARRFANQKRLRGVDNIV
jgi:hypothetical protein